MIIELTLPNPLTERSRFIAFIEDAKLDRAANLERAEQFRSGRLRSSFDGVDEEPEKAAQAAELDARQLESLIQSLELLVYGEEQTQF